MNILIEEHKQLLLHLVQENVEFILVGGYAVNFHGYNRATGDMDLWVRPDNNNKEILINALLKLDFTNEELEDLKKIDFTEFFVFSMWEKPLKVDILTRIAGVSFEEAWAQKVFLPLKDKQIPVLHLHHLVLSKISNARPRDKADVDELQKIQNFKKSKP